MIIKRKKTYYLVSPHPDLAEDLVTPKAPASILASLGIGKPKLPKISIYPGVTEALAGSEQPYRAGQRLFVYSPLDIRPDYTHRPSIQDLPAVTLTGETWITRPTRFKKIAEIEILGSAGELGEYKYGPRQTTKKLLRWKWKEVLQPWEKQGKLTKRNDDTTA